MKNKYTRRMLMNPLPSSSLINFSSPHFVLETLSPIFINLYRVSTRMIYVYAYILHILHIHIYSRTNGSSEHYRLSLFAYSVFVSTIARVNVQIIK